MAEMAMGRPPKSERHRIQLNQTSLMKEHGTRMVGGLVCLPCLSHWSHCSVDALCMLRVVWGGTVAPAYWVILEVTSELESEGQRLEGLTG